MTNDEIVAGLKNAIARGFSMESVVDSFINAGYNPVEVKAAAEFLTSSALSLNSSSSRPYLSKTEVAPQSLPKFYPSSQQTQVQSPYYSQPQPKKSKLVLTIIIILIILLLFVVGGVLGAIFFGEKILAILFGK